MYYVYILRCEDDTLYTGITTDVRRRIDEQREDKVKGAKYTKAHKPKEIAAAWEAGTKSDASKLEYRIKKLGRAEKEELILKISENIETESIAKEEDSKPEQYVPLNGWWGYPKDIKVAKRSGDDLLVLVNKEYRLEESYAPKDLVPASNAGIRKGESHKLREIVINDLRELGEQAKNDGIDLSVRSAYRSYADQLYTYNYWVKVNGNNPNEGDKVSARAGHSQHQLGTVVDFSSAEIQDGIGGQFHTTKAAKWLAENAWKYGFVIAFPKGYESVTGYNYESWHYRYIGKENAQEMMNRGEILEIYLRNKNN